MLHEHRFINENKFFDMCAHHEISSMFASYLRTLINYKIVIIADDSGSMNTLTNYKETRWSELCRFIQIVFSITETMENYPLDIHFLNRGSIIGIQNLQDITNAFISTPKGPTPIVPILKEILGQPYYDFQGRIIIIATDGEPTDENNAVNINQLKNVLDKDRSPSDYVTFLACTDDDDAICYLNKWDKQMVHVDVIDDYYNEKREVLRAQGKNFSFTYGDYVVKTMLGAVISQLDKLDESSYVDDCVCVIL